ncbi:glutathione S-transferase N-terminal domain-containing protein [Paraglaciecola sp. L1A13]|uniref:glutathione S-transferase N-terminal domain-containing protein n=1 Tax=Paraglaciecola sp. L1A13 TaxID=2686359 RepID=UPI00131BB90D|nr:glutathione S-transferase N-terminal domain-containing protein [Paraglaciecola sp. L1A13]
MKFIVKFIREALGRLIILVDLITRPRKQKRSPQEQAKVEEEISHYALYQFYACPFCVKTRRALHRLNLPMQKRNAKEGSEHRAALLSGGGAVKVPCLRIQKDGQDTWMYESSEIIKFLEQKFA